MTKTRPDGCNRDGESIARSTPTRIFQRTQKGKMRLELGRERRVREGDVGDSGVFRAFR